MLESKELKGSSGIETSVEGTALAVVGWDIGCELMPVGSIPKPVLVGLLVASRYDAEITTDDVLMVINGVTMEVVVVEATLVTLVAVDVVAIKVVETIGRHAAPTVIKPGPHDDEQVALPDRDTFPPPHGIQELLPNWANKEYVPAVQF